MAAEELDEFEAMLRNDDQCIYCFQLILVWYDKSYKGYLAYCHHCDTQWRVS